MKRLLWRVLGWSVVLFLLAPVAYTAWVSFSPDSFFTPPTREWSMRWYEAFLEDRRWMKAAVRSFQVGILSALLSVLLATMAAYAAREWPVRIRRGLTLLLLLPVCLPPAALATGLLPLAYFTRLWGTVLSLVLVHAALGLPIAFLIVQSHLTGRLSDLESVARGLGASRWQSVWRVTLPLLRMPLAAAGISVFVLSLNETMISLFLATPHNETLPAVSWPELRFAASPLVAVASCATAIIGTLCILAVVGIESRWISKEVNAKSQRKDAESAKERPKS